MNEKTGKPHEDKVAAARARMAELAAKFVARSAEEFETMRAAIAALGTGDSHALGEIRHLAHRMAGTGATLGFETFSDRAFDVEQLVERQAQDAAPDAASLGKLQAAVQALEDELRALERRTR